MILTVNTPANIYLNIRTGAPTTDSPTFMSLKGGAMVDVVDVVIGTPIEGSDIWYKCTDGNFYWSGGFDGPPKGFVVGNYIEKKIEFLADKTRKDLHRNSADENKWKVNWGHVDLGIWKIWSDYSATGDGVTIAVIDTGIDEQQNDLKSAIKSSSTGFTGNNAAITDNDGHGTMMAGMIAATGTDKICGIAPQSKLIILKATDSENDYDLDIFAKALLHAASLPEVDIISISYSFLDTNAALKSAVLKCLSSGKIIVTSIGNYRNILVSSDPDTYPAAYSSLTPAPGLLIAVGATEKDGTISEFSDWNNSISCVAPGSELLTTNTGNGTTTATGTSISAALVSGCLALLISAARKNNIAISTCVAALLNTCDPAGTGNVHNIKSGYGNINLKNAFSKLKIK